eukprot:TRINITY_DN103997_c0_g1_i1.p1 TRINITY_DN103997_c0_g1~~TRINITY_DN103997_c0_g1_i1.p1  ORF type:complete len:454 (+),score=87.44 TRINITY_DN103997_c0_g1_i1:235-1596(+)
MDDVDIYGDLATDVPVSSPVASLQQAPPSLLPPGESPLPPKSSTKAPAPAAETPREEWNAADPDAHWNDWAPGDALVVDAGEMVQPSSRRRQDMDFADVDAELEQRPQDFDALQKELLAEEQGVPSKPAGDDAGTGDAAAAADDGYGVADDDDDDENEGDGEEEEGITLGEVKASETGKAYFAGSAAAARRAQKEDAQAPAEEVVVGGSKKLRRREVTLFLGPPPPSSVVQQVAGCFVLLGGLPWWLSDSELRKHAEQFGTIRLIRLLDYVRSGKSAGVALIGYTTVEAATKALAPSQGLPHLPVWRVTKCVPKVMPVSSDLFEKMRREPLPWPEGGPCSDDVRSILMRQFDLEASVLTVSTRSRVVHRSPPGGKRKLDKSASTTPAPASEQSRWKGARRSADFEERPRTSEGGGGGSSSWTEKLKLLKAGVNNRTQGAQGGILPSDPRQRRR